MLEAKELRDDIEYSVQCEVDGKVIGPISKTYAHQEDVRGEICHYSTWSMMFNILTGKYGIQLKNPKKHDKHGAGKWDMGVAGHNQYVKYGGGYRYLGFSESLVKEAKEEIGIDIVMHDNQGDFLRDISKTNERPVGYIFEKFHYKTKINNEYVGLGFIITTSEKVNFTDDEVIDFKWLTPEELKEFIKDNKNYCDPLPLVFEKAEKFRGKHIK